MHHLSREARDDLDGIWEYLIKEGRGEAVADRQVDAITSRFHLIARHPKIGRARDDDLSPGTRSFPVDDYIIVYDINGRDVQILRVVHGRRNLAALFGR